MFQILRKMTAFGLKGLATVGATVMACGLLITPSSPVAANSSSYPASSDIAGMLSIGRTVACYIVDNGTVKCWGRNLEGQAGDPSLNNVTRGNDYTVANITNAVAVSAGSYHACALVSTGEVKCWGSQRYGTLGNGLDTTDKVTTPVTVSGISNAVDLEVSWYGGCVITADRAVKCWGYNSKGEVGDGTTTMRTSPVSVSVTNPIRLVAIDGMTTCVVTDGATSATSDNELWCWGRNDLNPLITTGSTNNVTSPTRITTDGTTPLLGVIAASSSGKSNCAILDDGTAWCWGSNNGGTLGNGSPSPTAVTYPVQVKIDVTTPVTGAVAISAVQASTCVMTINAGTKAQRCWGVAGAQPGTGVQVNSAYADAIPVVTAADVAHISAAETSTSPNGIGTYWCAIMTDKRLKCGNDTGSTVSPTLSAATLANPASWLPRPSTATSTTPSTTTSTTTTIAATTTSAPVPADTTVVAPNVAATNKTAKRTTPTVLPNTGTATERPVIAGFLMFFIGAGLVITKRRMLRKI